MEKKKRFLNIFRSSGTRQGSYSIGAAVLVIAVVIVINLIIGQIPEAYRNLDVSSSRIYEISDTTKNLLDSLDHDVNITVLAVKDETDDRITTFLSRYKSLSDRIHIKWIDPVLHPSALTEYDTTENTMVVSCDDTGKTTTVKFSDILVMDEYSYYYYGTSDYTEFDGEGQITGAVNYVTSNVEKKIYTTAGHGEGSLSSTVTDLMEKNNYQLSELNLLMTTSIPEDCDLLLMYAPVSDISEDEANMIESYLGAGGKVMAISGETNFTDLPNLAGILHDYGIHGTEGYIADPSRCYQGNYYYIFPELSVSEEMAQGISTQMVLLTDAHGMELVDPQRDSISVVPFMSSSDQAYAVTEDQQTQGEYVLGAVATESISNDDSSDSADGTDTKEDSKQSSDDNTTESRLTVISAGSLIDQSVTDTFTQLENTQLFMNAVTANFEGVQNLSIEAKDLGVVYNTVRHPGLFSFIVIFIIPAVILIGGFVVWFRRRKA